MSFACRVNHPDAAGGGLRKGDAAPLLHQAAALAQRDGRHSAVRGHLRQAPLCAAAPGGPACQLDRLILRRSTQLWPDDTLVVKSTAPIQPSLPELTSRYSRVPSTCVPAPQAAHQHLNLDYCTHHMLCCI